MMAKNASTSKNRLEELQKAHENDGFQIMTVPRPGKRLLVLDIDATIFDYTVPKDLPDEYRIRPHLQTFLADMYNDYDVALWSATPMYVIRDKAFRMKVTDNQDYQIHFFVNNQPMIKLNVPEVGRIKIKSLEEIWKRFPEYDKSNTVICDDQSYNFYLTPSNGLLVRPYTYDKQDKDTELLKVAVYLKYLARNCDDFSSLTDHNDWRKHVATVPLP